MTRLDWIRKATAAAFLIPLFWVWRLFAGERFYARTPVHPILGELPALVDILALSGIVALLILLMFVKSARLLLPVFLAVTFIFSLWDQSRWMPYFYQFWVMLLVIASRDEEHSPEDEERVLSSLRAVVLGIWLWSGLHKINAAYVAVGYPWMMRPLIEILPREYHGFVLGSSFLSPIVEGGGALCLLFPKTRPIGVAFLTSMHLFILALFGPLGLNWNPSVWSWNIVMIFYLWVFFWKSSVHPSELFLGTGKTLKKIFLHRLAAGLFIVMPFFNFFGYWDDFLSHCLYSWTTKEAEIVVTDQVESRLPDEMRRNIRRDQGQPLIPVLQWSFDIFNSPPYHAYRVFYSVFGKICEYTAGGEGITFRIFEKPAITTGHAERISYQCNPGAGPRAIKEVERRP